MSNREIQIIVKRILDKQEIPTLKSLASEYTTLSMYRIRKMLFEAMIMILKPYMHKGDIYYDYEHLTRKTLKSLLESLFESKKEVDQMIKKGLLSTTNKYVWEDFIYNKFIKKNEDYFLLLEDFIAD